jgi:DNA-binding NtrC family response regulator
MTTEQSGAVHLLFIDNDRSFMGLAQQLLPKTQGWKFIIHWTQTGQAALEELEKNPGIQLILLDYYLPEVNGLDVIRQIRSKQISVPIILLTSHRDFRLAIEAIKYEVEDYIVKDEAIESVLPRAIVNILERVQLKKQIAEQQKADLIATRRTEAIKELVVTVCHEFNNPLAAIKISTNIIARQDLPKDTKELVAELDRNISLVEAEITRLRDINFEKIEFHGSA